MQVKCCLQLTSPSTWMSQIIQFSLMSWMYAECIHNHVIWISWWNFHLIYWSQGWWCHWNLSFALNLKLWKWTQSTFLSSLNNNDYDNTFICHIFDIHLQLICHIANDGEDDKTCKHTSTTVADRYDESVPGKVEYTVISPVYIFTYLHVCIVLTFMEHNVFQFFFHYRAFIWLPNGLKVLLLVSNII